MITIKLHIPQDKIDKLQRIGFELEGQKRVIKDFISDNSNSPDFLNTPIFKKYEDRYYEKNAEFELARTIVQDEFIPEKIVKSVNWNLDFNSGIMTVDYLGNQYTEKQLLQLVKEWEAMHQVIPEDSAVDNKDLEESLEETE